MADSLFRLLRGYNDYFSTLPLRSEQQHGDPEPCDPCGTFLWLARADGWLPELAATNLPLHWFRQFADVRRLIVQDEHRPVPGRTKLVRAQLPSFLSLAADSEPFGRQQRRYLFFLRLDSQTRDRHRKIFHRIQLAVAS